jgi:hypothetical protein
MDQMQPARRDRAQPADVARILRDAWLEKNHVEHAKTPASR